MTKSRGAGDLEVHVAERVLGTEDVGEGDVLALVEHEAHRDAGDRRLDRHAGVHQRQRRAAHRRHRRGAVRREHVGDDAHRVRPLVGVGHAPARAPARRAHRDRSRGASANRRGPVSPVENGGKL